ncbi:MAG: hypothetical protein BWY42_00179 [Candidatus Omnitrophica bacterium ADurb.Bin277]|nr:MAG: hypothetical protein BWY42_00179 [Candidatus Omnitrophica bacterium ADurb.Bin277]
MPYEIFEHTADIGLRLEAGNLEGLFRDAASGFFELSTDYAAFKNPSGETIQPVEMNFQEENAEELFMRWLQELLFFFSARRLVMVDIRFITLTPLMLKMKGSAVRFIPHKHAARYEIKAVTHHRFRVARTKSGWEAEVVFDV